LPLSFAKLPLSLNPSAAGYRFFYLSDPSIAPSKKETVRFVGSSRQQKKDHDSSQRAVASSVYWGKIEKTFLSLPERRAENALGRFPGLGFNLLAAPSHPSTQLRTVTCVAAFVAITVAGPRRIFTGLP
jgi:hypothetical protein